MNLIDDERVGLEDVAFLEPAARDAGGDDDDVPRGRLWRSLPLAIHHADPQVRVTDNFLRDRPDRERLAGAGAGDDAETAARTRELAHPVTVMRLEVGLDVKLDGQLDRFAGCARRGDHDDPTAWRFRGDECLVLGDPPVLDRADQDG